MDKVWLDKTLRGNMFHDLRESTLNFFLVSVLKERIRGTFSAGRRAQLYRLHMHYARNRKDAGLYFYDIFVREQTSTVTLCLVVLTLQPHFP